VGQRSLAGGLLRSGLAARALTPLAFALWATLAGPILDLLNELGGPFLFAARRDKLATCARALATGFLFHAP